METSKRALHFSLPIRRIVLGGSILASLSLLFFVAYNYFAVTPEEELMAAARIGDTPEVERLIKSGADVNCVQNGSHSTPLIAAAGNGSNGYTDTVCVLLRHGADFKLKDHRGDTALKVAKDARHSEIVQLLLKAGAKE